MNRDWWASLAGLAFVVVAIVGIIVGGEPPNADSPAQEIVDFYADNKDSVMIGTMIVALSGTLLIFFAGYLRKVLRAAEGEGGMLSTVAFAGAVVMAVGAAIDGTISFALAEAADDIEPASMQALQALWDNDFVPIAMGTQVFLLAAGISIARNGALPKWLGWVAILLGVMALTPIGFVGFLGGALWIAVVSVMLTLRLRRTSAPAA